MKRCWGVGRKEESRGYGFRCWCDRVLGYGLKTERDSTRKGNGSSGAGPARAKLHTMQCNTIAHRDPIILHTHLANLLKRHQVGRPEANNGFNRHPACRQLPSDVHNLRLDVLFSELGVVDGVSGHFVTHVPRLFDNGAWREAQFMCAGEPGHGDGARVGVLEALDDFHHAGVGNGVEGIVVGHENELRIEEHGGVVNCARKARRGQERRCGGECWCRKIIGSPPTCGVSARARPPGAEEEGHWQAGDLQEEEEQPM
jgi:hypothetical protein